MDSTLNRSLADEILAGVRSYKSRPVVEFLQLLGMTGLHHGLVDSPMFPNLFQIGLLREDLRFLEALEQLDILYDISSNLPGFMSLCYYYFPRRSLDPFRIQFMKQWIINCPGFGDIPDGIERIVNHQLCLPGRLVHDLPVPADEVWFGLGPIFWAATDPSALRVLLAQGHDPNLTDRDGLTPVFYAATYGETTCVLQLLEAGAQPDFYDHYRRANFLRYAMENNHPHVAIRALQYLQSAPACSDEVFQILLHESLAFACEQPHIRQSSLLVKSIFLFGADPNALSHSGYTFGHILNLLVHAEVLFDHGFRLLNMVGPRGESCLHIAAREHNVQLVRFYISKGARLQARDRCGQNPIHKSLAANCCRKPHSWYSTTRTLIEHGVDVLIGDHCRCVCSRMGCSPVTGLCTSFYYDIAVYPACILSIEYLMLLEELSGNLAAEETLAELVRFFLFEELELTHVCCWTSVEEDDISEIQDEEGVLIDQLEEEIDMVLEKLSDRKAVEFWEEFLLDFIVKNSRSTGTPHLHKFGDRRKLTCLECWHNDISSYSKYINDIYDERMNDEFTRDLNDAWLQRRTSLIQRCRSTIESLLKEQCEWNEIDFSSLDLLLLPN